jgi:branched-chain amino acid transport system ATP-binding protein
VIGLSILEIQDLTMRFGGLEVFSHINISVKERQIYGIIGTNGSGKTTLFNIITGVYKPVSGKVIFEGRDITGKKTWNLSRMGIGRCFQTAVPFKSMSPLENIRVARGMAGKHNRDNEMFSLDEILELTGLENKRHILTGELSLPDKKNVEIARALACNPKLILFDEVSCGLSGEEIHTRMALMKKLSESGLTIVVVEHVMMFIKEICHQVSVMHSGNVIAEGPPEQIAQNKRVIDAYLGGRKL